MKNSTTLDVFAFYLPQFHSCEANDKFWAPGFTDWVTTRSAKPLFEGHQQPNMPGELGYYDLTDKEVIKAQAKMARDSGLKGFAIYHYWFSPEQRALETPINLIREDRDIDIDYFVSWVNADWTKSWVGDSKTVINKQSYSEELYIKIMMDACLHFREKRYYKIEGKPVFYIHCPKAFCVSELIKIGNDLAKKSGFPGVVWIAPETHVLEEQKQYLDYLLGYPPGDCSVFKTKRMGFGLRVLQKLLPSFIKVLLPFKVTSVFDYERYVEIYSKFIAKRIVQEEKYIPTAMSSWDNTPRYGERGFVLEKSDPGLNKYLYEEMFYTCAEHKKPFCMVKAWNEWAEGNYLEPDLRYGRQRLDALHAAKKNLR